MGIRPGIRVVGLVLLLLGLASPAARAEMRSEHIIEATVLDGGDLEVVETVRLLGNWSDSYLSRSFWLRPAQDAWPLRQSISNVSAEEPGQGALAVRTRRYEDRANIDLLELPSGDTVRLHYRVHRGLVLDGDEARLQWMVTGYAWPGLVEKVKVLVRTPWPASGAALSYAVGYGDAEANSVLAASEADGVSWEFQPSAKADEPVTLALSFPRGSLAAPPARAWWRDVFELVRVSVAAFAALVLLGVVLIFVRPRHAQAATAIANFVPGAIALIAAAMVTRYWYFEQSVRGAGDDFTGEFIINFGLAGFVLLFAWKQREALQSGTRAAYFAQLGFPAVLVVAWPLAFVDRSMLLFPLLALPLYLYWPRRSIALEFGVGAHRISEEVGGRGEVAVATLASELRMSPETLRKALRQNPHLPVVYDHERDLLLSAEAAAMRETLRVCTYCGGATEVVGMAVRACGYCQREYKSNTKRKARKPVPVVIESHAMFFEMLSGGAYVFAGTVALAIIAMEFVGGSVVDGLIGAVIAGGLFCIPAALLGTLGAGLRRGHNVGVVKGILVAFAWILWPLILPLRKLSSRRVQIFCGDFDVEKLGTFLTEKGEVSLSEFSDYLACSREDAAEFAQYIAVNQIIDAVYDRRAERMVARQLYRDIASEGSCHTCGGFYGVHGGRAVCHFCGASTKRRRATSEAKQPT